MSMEHLGYPAHYCDTIEMVSFQRFLDTAVSSPSNRNPFGVVVVCLTTAFLVSSRLLGGVGNKGNNRFEAAMLYS